MQLPCLAYTLHKVKISGPDKQQKQRLCTLLCVYIASMTKPAASAGPQQTAIPGNPAYFAKLVFVRLNAQILQDKSPMQLKEIEGKIIYCACGDLMRMDTEAAAAAYRASRVRAKPSLWCPGIMCRDTSSLIDASGVVSDGDSHRAPATLDALRCGYFGSLPSQQRPEYQRWQRAITSLGLTFSMRIGLLEAKVSKQKAAFGLLGLAHMFVMQQAM